MRTRVHFTLSYAQVRKQVKHGPFNSLIAPVFRPQRERKEIIYSTLSEWKWKKKTTVSRDGKLNQVRWSVHKGYTERLLYVVRLAEVDSMSKAFGTSNRQFQSSSRSTDLPVISFSSPFQRLNSSDEVRSLRARGSFSWCTCTTSESPIPSKPIDTAHQRYEPITSLSRMVL